VGLALSQNKGHDPSHILQNFVGSYPQGSVIMRHKPFVPRLVVRRAASPLMRFPIYLNGQSGGQTNEVEDESAGGVLTSEFETARALPKFAPEQDFGQRHITAEAACPADSRARSPQHSASPSTMLRMVPLPVPGRILHGANP
jgi:hypothetical protein